MCTAALQSGLPDFMTNLQGTSATVPDRSASGVDLPLDEAANQMTILKRRERIKQAQENPGSHKPTGVRTRKDIMDELT